MKSTILTIATLLGLAALVGGCAVSSDTTDTNNDDNTVASAESEIGVTTKRFVTLRHDDRKCMYPMCGGYFVQDVNKTTDEVYVSDLDFSESNLDDTLIAKVQSAPAQELVLFASFTVKTKKQPYRKLVVAEAYRGMPGVTRDAADVFYKAADRDPQINCFAAPCPNEVAFKLNVTAKAYFGSYNVEHAALAHVDQAWLIDRVNHHDAIVAAKIVSGQKYPAGYEKILDASQVYLKITDMTGPCPAMKLAKCPEGQVWTFTRNDDLCILPEHCAIDSGNCPSLQPPQCADGYVISGWRTDSPMCQKLACDPAFLTQE